VTLNVPVGAGFPRNQGVCHERKCRLKHERKAERGRQLLRNAQHFHARVVRCSVSVSSGEVRLHVWTRLSPSVFPNVGTAPTLASHDAAVLHGLRLRLHFGSHNGGICVFTGTIQAQVECHTGRGAGEIEAFPLVLLLSSGDMMVRF
jgi:hypothetical protein